MISKDLKEALILMIATITFLFFAALGIHFIIKSDDQVSENKTMVECIPKHGGEK